MKDRSQPPAEPTPRKPYEAPAVKEFGTIADLTKTTNSSNTAKDNTPANTKT